MVTNTFTPHIGGVARSVQTFTDEYRRLGHKVAVVAPGVEGEYKTARDVLRIPALGNVNSSTFAYPLVDKQIQTALKFGMASFKPDVVHSHHPFLLGSIARKLSDAFKVPLVFTHHTMYEEFSYVLGDVGRSKLAKDTIANVATTFANTCDRVIAPSESTASILRARGVHTPMDVVPTGIDTQHFASGDRATWRAKLGIPLNAPVFGCVGRLAPEKNLGFLLEAAKTVLLRNVDAHFILVGDGPAGPAARKYLASLGGLAKRAHALGARSGRELADAFAALDVFAFASHSETQGMVLAEAMAAGVPVVALDASGSRDVVRDGVNGRLVYGGAEEFEDAIEQTLWSPGAFRAGALATAATYSQEQCALKAISAYRRTTFHNKDVAQLQSFAKLFG